MKITYLTKDTHQQLECDYNEVNGPINHVLEHINRDIQNKEFIVITNIVDLS